MSAKVWLVGAGPGDPELLTLKAVKALQRADIVMIDDLVNPAVLEHCPAARVVPVGKRGGALAGVHSADRCLRSSRMASNSRALRSSLASMACSERIASMRTP